MTNQMNSEPKKNSSTSTILIVVVGIIIIGLLAVIIFVLLGNQGDTPAGENPPQIDLPSQLPSGPTVTALQPINLRSGPSTDYPSYGIAPVGSMAEVIGISADGGWWVVKLPLTVTTSGQGWVSADYVSADNIGEPPVVEPPPLP
jgi:hypothetical protein